MTKQSILEERKFCSKRIKSLRKEIMEETDKVIALTKIEEMSALAQRATNLDAMYAQIVSDEVDRQINSLLDLVMKGV